VAATLNDADWPAVTLSDAGCAVIVGAVAAGGGGVESSPPLPPQDTTAINDIAAIKQRITFGIRFLPSPPSGFPAALSP
jgi:hypothetical protein